MHIITNTKYVKYLQIFTNIKAGYEYYNLPFSPLGPIFWNNKG